MAKKISILAFGGGLWRLGAGGTPDPTLPIRVGETLLSAALPITCRPPNSSEPCTSSLTWEKNGPTAILCADPVPWRCRRSLIGDALAVRGVEVRDTFTPARAEVHTLTPMAKVQGIRITYPS